MAQGKIESIYIAPAEGEPTVSVNEVKAVAGKGLENDRYFDSEGAGNPKHLPKQEATFIEIESIEALKRDHNLVLHPKESRRNLVTRNVPLNHLVGKEFKVGSATFRGIKLCEPCSYLQNMTQQGILAGLTHRGGLMAQILTDGIIKTGDSVSYD